MNKLISVIVTVYNREKFLRECLDSLKNQIYINFEAIIVDDGSTDNSLEIARSYQENDERFKVIASPHVGFPEAKNIGLRNVQGDYIIFLDSDDNAYPEWLQLLYEACELTGADISVCLYDEYNEKKGKALEPTMEQYCKKGIFLSEYSYLKMNLLFQYGCTSYMWNKLIRKELYEGIEFVDQIALSDTSTMYKIFDKANKIVQIHLPLIHYRRHMDSIGGESSKIGLDYYIFRMGIFKEIFNFIQEKYPQSQRSLQLLLQTELMHIAKRIPKEDFYQFIYTEEFKQILEKPTMAYLNKM